MQLRLIIAATVAVVLAFVLIGRLIYLQIGQYERYSTLSQDNRIDLVSIPPVRGLIYDRTGTVLANNHPVYNLEITPDKVEDMDATLDELGQLVHLREEDLERFRQTIKRRPGFERQPLRLNLSDQDAARFAINQYRFPGVELRAGLLRHYPLGALTGHVVGYVGRISEKDLERIDRAQYRGTEYIGKLGIESHYEHVLLGQAGFKRVETNAHGRQVRSISRTPSISGTNLHLTLDFRLQEVARDALKDYQGAIVALEPATGDVLAFVSKPSYDPNPFVTGIDKISYAKLRESSGRPLLNRALHGRYAPGSTIKGFMGLVGLESGHGADQRFFCPGWFSLPNSRHRYRCWKKSGHGWLSLKGAIEQSCDVYFYRLATKLGIDRMHKHMTAFGFGRRSGVDMDDEPEGLMPSREWKERVRGEIWYPGETVITGIGQGYTLVTPLQLAVATATLANRGQPVRPRFLRAVEDAQTRLTEELAVEQLPPRQVANPAYYDIIIKAMEDVVHGKRGTARRMGMGSRYRFAGKTGTAQVINIGQNEKYDADKLDKRFHDHALFIAFAPLDNPKIVVAVVAENGGSGSKTAAPMARKVMDYYLVDRHHRA